LQTHTIEGATPDHRSVIEFWHTYSDIETKVFETQVVPLFEKENPDIKIHATRVDYTDQLKNNILASVADNKQPDVMRLDIVWVPELAKNGALVDITGFNGFNQIRDGILNIFFKTDQYRDKFYGLPLNANTKVAIFNLKLLKEAGLTAPPVTFTELEKTVKLLQQRHPDLFGIGLCCSFGWGTLPYFWTLGGKLTDDNYTRANGFLDSPGSIAAITQIKKWYKDRIIGPSLNGGEPGTWDGILKGELLMIDEAQWFYGVNSNGANKTLLKDTVAGKFPNDVNQGTSVVGGEDLVLLKNSKHQDASWRFMKWMVTEQPQKIMAGTGLIPILKQMQNPEQFPDMAPYMEQLKTAQLRPPVSVWDDMDKTFAKMIERVLNNEQSVIDAVHEAVSKIDVLLNNQ
jgi:multiple sugar transport system substrate-binding protein